ncbi:MAG: hypothetical protein II720_05820 [Bacteroidales bacterium]|nr:hypothetical protein [Bacteroidales bacterium]
MKKFIFAIALSLLVAGCTREDMAPNKITVPLAVTLSDATKAVSDGASVNDLYICVYDAQENLVQKTKVSRTGTGAFSASLSLVRGESYTAAFWAQSSSSAVYSVTGGDVRSVAADYSSAVASTESEDAFAGKTVFTASEVSPVNATLTRAVVMLDFRSTTEPVYSEPCEDPHVFTSSVTVSGGAATSYNALTGTASGLAEEAVFGFKVIPGDVLPSTTEASLYRAAYAYVLPGAESAAKVTVTVRRDGAYWRECSGQDVPLTENFRTNLTGSML